MAFVNRIPNQAVLAAVLAALLVVSLVSPLFAAGPETATFAWTIGVEYPQGTFVTYRGKLYACLHDHRAQYGWEPPNAPMVWRVASTQ